jgi:signal transduction histidine kinase
MKKPSVGTRIFLLYGSILGVLFLFSVLSYYFVTLIREEPERIVEENVTSLEAAIHMKRQIFYQKETMRQLILKGWNPELMKTLYEDRENFQSWFTKAWIAAFTDEEQNILMVIQSLNEKISSIQDEMGEKRFIPKVQAVQVIEDYGAMRGLCLQMLEINKKLISKIMNKRNIDYRRMNIIILTILIGGVSISLILLFFLTRGITRPLHRLVDEAESYDSLKGENNQKGKEDEFDKLDKHMHHIITLLESSDKTISEQRQRLLHAERLAAMGELSAKIAHEVRNPLTGMRTGIQLLKRQTLENESFQRKLGRMIQDLNRVERIVSDLLNYSRPLKPDLKRIDLMKLIKESIEEISAEMDEKGISVESGNYGSPSFEADPDMLKQVFYNILKNASENLAKGDRVAVRLEEGASDSDSHVHLVIEDTGPGIPPEQIENIFKPFVTNKPMGTGLGLSICQNIIIEHKGKIWVENGSSKGLKVNIVLPKRQKAV